MKKSFLCFSKLTPSGGKVQYVTYILRPWITTNDLIFLKHIQKETTQRQ